MKSSLILGYGSTGQDIEKYLISKKEKYFIYDDNKTIPQDLNFRYEDITNVETLFVSPGIRKNHKILNLAEENKVKITTDVEFFNEISNVKIIGVSGTNGKTSFVTLLNKLLNKYGFKSNVAGNIGISPLNLIEDSDYLDFLILELSSFQLKHINELNLDTSVVLNLYEDHIDWHESFEDYVSSKLKIFDFTSNNKNKYLGPVDDEIKNKNLLPKNISLLEDIGEHLLPNYFDEFVSMLITVCKRFEISKKEVIDFLSSEPSGEHRFELFFTKNGVKFINDSKSTNLESVNKASFKVNDCLLIMHGLSKGINTKKLKLSDEIKKILIPKNSEFDITSCKNIVREYESFDELKLLIQNEYKTYDTVLFSCGGSSFNDFDDYIDRGNFFKHMIKGEIT